MISLYIHIPFCVRKCRYCGFYSTAASPGSVDEFIFSLSKEASTYRQDFRMTPFTSIYIGGGTPTVLSPVQFERLMLCLRDNFAFSDGVEFTVEANPDTVTREKLASLAEQGVNRLSLGMQSFSNEVLQTLGRPHTSEQAVDAFCLARDAGFENISVDLMYGIPGQSATLWAETLESVLMLKPEHVSAYCLSLDDGSLFKRESDKSGFQLPDEEVSAGMYESAVQKLNSAGYGRYEISNFSMPGRECRHNMNYWNRGEYLGLGPGASSFISNRRYSIIADITEYSRRLSRGTTVIAAQEIIGPDSSAREAILLGLRTMQGLDLFRFEQEYGSEILQQLERNADRLSDAGLLLVSGGHMKLTDRGILLSDEAFARLSV